MKELKIIGFDTPNGKVRDGFKGGVVRSGYIVEKQDTGQTMWVKAENLYDVLDKYECEKASFFEICSKLWKHIMMKHRFALSDEFFTEKSLYVLLCNDVVQDKLQKMGLNVDDSYKLAVFILKKQSFLTQAQAIQKEQIEEIILKTLKEIEDYKYTTLERQVKRNIA